MTSDSILEADFDEMGRRWLGLGNLHSDFWFVGMEPGGAEDPAWPSTWATKFGGAVVVDLHDSATDADRRWLGPYNVVHPTWTPLIRTRLSYAGLPADDRAVLAYQRERFCRADGDEALLEISAYAARHIGLENVPADRYREERIERLRALIEQHRPAIVVCLGTNYRHMFEELCGGPFASDGYRVSGSTLCTLVPHPKPRYRTAPPAEVWTGLGLELRDRVDGRAA